MPFLNSLVTLCLVSFAALAQAETTTRYTIAFQGKQTGEQVVTSHEDGRVVVDFAWSNNGRGPLFHEEMAIDEASRFTHYRATGKSEFGAPIDETFDYADGRARWKSTAEAAEREGSLAAIYIPVDSSFEPLAVAARALLRQPGHSMAVLPAGQISIKTLKETTLRSPAGPADVALYAIFGIDIAPQLIWLRNDATQRFFAGVYPGFAAIEAGWENRADELLDLQRQAERDLLSNLANQLAHRFDGPILIRAVRIFDPETASMRGPYDVYVFRGRIASIDAPDTEPRDPGAIIDGRGRYLLPGLFDMHAHESRWNAMLQIAGGVTTVRDMGNDNRRLEELRTDIENGSIVGPRIVPTGFIEGNSPYAARDGIVIDSVEDGKAAIDWYAQRGRRQIKLYNSIRPEWVRPLAEYAHARGLRVSGHVPAFMRAEEAVRAGYDEVQHINQVMLNFLVKPGDDTRTLLRFYLVGDNAAEIDLTSEDASKFFELLRARGTVIDTTIATFEPPFTQVQGEPNPAYRKVASHAPPTLQRAWLTNSLDLNAQNATRFRASYAKLLELTRRMHEAGIPFVAGTDNIAGFTLHRELEIYAQAGISPAEALQIATRNGAKYTQLSDLTGSIAIGKLADLILLDADPTQDISAVRDISLVMKEGVVYYPAKIYEALGVEPFRPPPDVMVKR